MAFENFPYANFHELNLDWILERVKEAYSASNPPDYPVKSVNGMTGDVIIAIPSALVRTVNGESGDVILYRNPLIQFPTTDESRWNLFRICDGNSGDARGIEFDEDGAHRIEGTRRILIYDEENQPDFPVTSVNGQTGDVRITAGVNSVNGKTGNVVTPFVNPNADILTLDSNSNTVLWGISRNVSGGNVALYISRGTGTPQAFIRYTPDGGEPVNLPLLTNADIPAEAGVVSVNTKTGVVTLYGTDVLLSATSTTTITDSIEYMESQISLISKITDAIVTKVSDTSLWSMGSFYSSTGARLNSDSYCRTNDYIPADCIRITTIDSMRLRLFAWENDVYVGLLNTAGEFSKNFGSSNPRPADLPMIDIASYHENFPTYNFKVVVGNYPLSTITIDETENVYFLYSNMSGYDAEIAELRDTTDAIEQDIIDLQNADTTHSQQISALQSDNDTQDQEISTLQSADSTHNQQIAELQSADAAHNQQISALQASQATQDQQISELYTRTGVYVISIPNANTLPLRFPASGTDAKIKDTNKVVSMDLSIPGTQVYNWTITTYDGYLEIIGTMNGTSDITLYLS